PLHVCDSAYTPPRPLSAYTTRFRSFRLDPERRFALSHLLDAARGQRLLAHVTILEARRATSGAPCVASATVSRFVGNGCSACVFGNAVADNASPIAASATARRRLGMRLYPLVPGKLTRRRYSSLDSRVNEPPRGLAAAGL